VLSGQFVRSSSAIVSSFSTFSRTIPLCCAARCFVVVIVMDNHKVVMYNRVIALKDMMVMDNDIVVMDNRMIAHFFEKNMD